MLRKDKDKVVGCVNFGIGTCAEAMSAATARWQDTVAVNNYRQSGSGNFPHVATAPVVYNRQVEIRQLMIDYVLATGEVNPGAFHTVDWCLTANGKPLTVSSD